MQVSGHVVTFRLDKAQFQSSLPGPAEHARTLQHDVAISVIKIISRQLELPLTIFAITLIFPNMAIPNSGHKPVDLTCSLRNTWPSTRRAGGGSFRGRGQGHAYRPYDHIPTFRVVGNTMAVAEGLMASSSFF
jgi:hypothetical protein